MSVEANICPTIVEYTDQLRNLGRRLADANGALLVWDQIEARRMMPKAQRGAPIPRPELSRQALKLQLILLLADVSRLEQEISAAPALSIN
jgi:hypothetical protein